MLQELLPVYRQDSTRINDYLAYAKEDGKIWYFNATMPIFSHPEECKASFRMFTSQLCVNGNCRQVDIVNTFGVTSISVKRSVKKYRDGGPEAFYTKKRPVRNPRVFTPEILEKARDMLGAGKSRSEISDELGIKPDTLYRAIKSGKLGEPHKGNDASTQSERSCEDSLSGMGMGCTRVVDRVAASAGALEEAESVFEKSLDVPKGGVLCAIPALLANGLFKDNLSEYFSRFRKGFYSLTQIFVLLAFMALARIKNVDRLRSHSPGELGLLLGLDRVPEVRTLRLKIGEIAESGKPFEWSASLSKEWMESDPKSAGVLYVDGCVRVYNGSKTKLPRRYVARQRLCLRGMTDYWVNDRQGRPFFVVATPFTSGMIDMMKNDIVPRLEKDVPEQPGESELEADPDICRFVIVFDREGYSPAFFKEMWEKRIACQTYHKYPKEIWSESEFREYKVEMSFGNKETMKLAEREITLSNGLCVREIRKLTQTGHQTSVISTDYKAEITAIAVHMFSRWSQENFFKYMRNEYNIQGLVDYRTEAADETKMVVNPKHREIEGRIKSKAAKLARKKAEFYDNSLKGDATLEETAEYERKKGEIQEQIDFLSTDVEKLKAERKKTPKHLQLCELPTDERFEQLSTIRKQFMDTIKMISYRAETADYLMLREYMSKPNEGRKLIKNIYSSPADLIPNEKEKTLTVRLHNFSSHLNNQAVLKYCEHLNETETVYPGTEMRMIFELVSN